METDKLKEIAKPIVESHGCDIVLISFVRERQGFVLRLLVEKKGSDPFAGSGIDHEICSKISRSLGSVIEENGLIDRQYVMEVSSPGIERPLTGPKDYQRFKDRLARIKTREPVSGKKSFKGKIIDCEDGILHLEINTGKKVADIPMQSIAGANLVFDTKLSGKDRGEK